MEASHKRKIKKKKINRKDHMRTTSFQAGPKLSEKRGEGRKYQRKHTWFLAASKRKRKHSAFLSQDSERRMTQQSLMQLCSNTHRERAFWEGKCMISLWGYYSSYLFSMADGESAFLRSSPLS